MNLLKPRTESNWHPHGCVKLDLSELWLGQTCFEFYIPIVPCHAPESGASEFFSPPCCWIEMRVIVERGTNAKRLETLRIQQGDFLASGTQMQIQVKLAKPLVRPTERRLLDDRQFTTTTVNFPSLLKNEFSSIEPSDCTIYSDCLCIRISKYEILNIDRNFHSKYQCKSIRF